VARIRTVKPSLFEDEKLLRCTIPARFLFIGLLVEADDDGRMLASPKRVSGAVFPNDDDVTPKRVARWLDELEREGRVLRYDVEGVTYLWIPNFRKHQRIDHPTPSKLPAPPSSAPPEPPSPNGSGPPDSRKVREGLPKSSRPPRETFAPGSGSGSGSAEDLKQQHALELQSLRAREEPVAAADEIAESAGQTPEREAILALRTLGVGLDTARQLVTEHGADAVISQCEWLPKRVGIRDRKASVIAAIRGDWEEPDDTGAPRQLPNVDQVLARSDTGPILDPAEQQRRAKQIRQTLAPRRAEAEPEVESVTPETP